MLKIIRRVAEWGIQPNTSAEQAQHFRLTNVLLLFMCIASIVETVACFLSGAYTAAAINSTAPFLFASGLWLMKLGHTVLARVFVITLADFAAVALALSLGPDSHFQFILLFASAFAIVFFSHEEKFFRAFGLLLPLICFAWLEVTDYSIFPGITRARLSDQHLTLMRVASSIVIWSLMMFHFYYFISDRRKAQEQLVSSAKMVALGRMAAGIAHEVNNPLQLIVSHAENLKAIANSPTAPPEQIAMVSDRIQAVAMRIAAINKGLLSLSRDASSDPFAEVSVRSIVNLSLDYCRARLESHRVELVLSEIPEDWFVIGRETQLSEVVLNVLNNAFDAVIECPNKRVEVDVTASTDWINISISDSGPGVIPKLHHRIFDPFFTTKPVGRGTGLGLSVSQAIMAAHGGQVYYEPSSSGARFVIRVARAKAVPVSM